MSKRNKGLKLRERMHSSPYSGLFGLQRLGDHSAAARKLAIKLREAEARIQELEYHVDSATEEANHWRSEAYHQREEADYYRYRNSNDGTYL